MFVLFLLFNLAGASILIDRVEIGKTEIQIQDDTTLPTLISENTETTTVFPFDNNSYDGQKILEVSAHQNDVLHGDVDHEINKLDNNELEEELLKWTAPQFYLENYPYYLSGFDDDDRPVWISEIGKYPSHIVAERGEEAIKILEKYLRQAVLRVIKSIESQNTTEAEVTEAIFILDGEGLKLSQILNRKFVVLMIKMFAQVSDLINNYLGRAIIVNANYPTELAINILRPILGGAMEKVEIYGTNRAKWLSILHRILPQDIIPPWYGGSSEYKPIQVYGGNSE